MASETIFVVEDDQEIRELLRYSLGRLGYRVVELETAEAALDALDGPLPDLVLIDWMLPGISGLELATRIRHDPLLKDLPLIMVTARGEEEDKLRSFDGGLDDHITKPFSPRELTARIRALLRRARGSDDGQFHAGELVLDTTAQLVSVQGAAVHLRPTEFRLLELFVRNPRRAFRRSQILDQVWGRKVYIDQRTVDVHVLRLRTALERHDLGKLVQTVRGVGYRLNPEFLNAA